MTDKFKKIDIKRLVAKNRYLLLNISYKKYFLIDDINSQFFATSSYVNLT